MTLGLPQDPHLNKKIVSVTFTQQSLLVSYFKPETLTILSHYNTHYFKYCPRFK